MGSCMDGNLKYDKGGILITGGKEGLSSKWG